jgi:hypothetical protein
MPAQFAPFWLAIFGYTTPPTSPSDAEIDQVARVAGETSFKNGIAGSMYPTQREEKAQAKYTKAYADCNAAEKQYVDAAVCASLASAFGTGAVADATRGAIRNSMAASLKAYYGLSSDNYSLLKGREKAMVDQAVGAQLDAKDPTYGFYTKPLGFGPHLEKDYVDFSALPGAVLGLGSELGGTLPWKQNMAYLALSAPPAGTVTAAEAFVKDVDTYGIAVKTAFYRWLAKEKVKETASAALLIQQSVGEFYFTITNPNKYEIKIDQIVFAFRTTVGASSMVIDGARQTVDGVYVPAEGQISLKVVAPTKVYDLLSWLTIAGQGANARAYAAQVWSNIQAGTITWTFTAEMKVSHGDEIENYSYPV